MDLAADMQWADEIITVDNVDPVESVLSLTEGHGADVVVDAAGSSKALQTALECVKRLGRVVKIGWGPEPYGHSLDILLRKSVHLSGTFGHNWRSWRAVLELMEAGRIDPKAMISKAFPISQWQQAFELAESKQAVKVLIKPEE